MKRILAISLAAIAATFCLPAAGADGDVTVSNKVVFVDGEGRNNAPEFIASVAAQTSNETAVVVAAAKAEAAAETAEATTNAIQDVVVNIMSNNLVIYSYGNHDSFSVAVAFDETDEVRIIDTPEHRLGFSKSGSTLTAVIPFLVTKDLGVTKPTILGCDSMDSGFVETEIPDADVSAPTSIQLPPDIAASVPTGKTAYGYKVTATVRNVYGASYFFKVRLSGDAPPGDGSTLNLPNGVRDGLTETVGGTGGWPTLKFVGGVLKEVVYD